MLENEEIYSNLANTRSVGSIYRRSVYFVIYQGPKDFEIQVISIQKLTVISNDIRLPIWNSPNNTKNTNLRYCLKCLLKPQAGFRSANIFTRGVNNCFIGFITNPFK